MTHMSISGYGAAANLDLFHKLSFWKQTYEMSHMRWKTEVQHQASSFGLADHTTLMVTAN
jgi:hypothetical protein